MLIFVRNIVPFLKKYRINPVNGNETKLSDLIKLNITKSKTDRMGYMCPISMKDFTLTTKIVAIKTTGNVFSASVVDELNKKHNNWTDLITGEPFKPTDIIVLQDPMKIEGRLITQFDYVNKGWDRSKLKALIRGEILQKK
jgi:peptidyl-prolyl cis-trans isomerase-like protein 2